MSDEEVVFGDGDQYFVKKKPGRKYEARRTLCAVSQLEFLALIPAGDVKLENLNDPAYTYIVRVTDEPIPASVERGLVDFNELPTEEEFHELPVAAHADRDEVLESRAQAAKIPPRKYQRTPEQLTPW
jgi:hypothetical protein